MCVRLYPIFYNCPNLNLPEFSCFYILGAHHYSCAGLIGQKSLLPSYGRWSSFTTYSTVSIIESIYD